MTQHWHMSWTHSKSQLFHILNTEITWLNTHSTTALATGMQRQNKAYAATSKMSIRIKDVNCVCQCRKKYSCLVLPMQKQKYNWNWSVKHFILRMKFSKISLFKMVLKRLKLHQVFIGVAPIFSDTQPWVLEGGKEFKNFSKKGYYLSFVW